MSSRYLDPPEFDGVGGKVSVILLAHQQLAWKLPVELETSRVDATIKIRLPLQDVFVELGQELLLIGEFTVQHLLSR